MTHTYKLIEPKIPWKQENKNKEKTEIIAVGFRKLLLCFFFFAVQFSHVISQCFLLIKKLTIKRILSISLTPHATAHNNNKYTNLCNFKVQIAFVEQFDHENIYKLTLLTFTLFVV